MRPQVTPGKTYGRLSVVALADGLSGGSRSRWLCRCSCGQTKVVRADNLKSGGVQSCGCLRGGSDAIHGMCNSREYNSWRNMLSRCTNSNAPGYYQYYGGRGITVCDRWRHSFQNFFDDMGKRPPGHTLDRIDNDGDYEPGNCKWSTHSEQVLNRRPSSQWKKSMSETQEQAA